MFYTYVLLSLKDDDHYIGYTDDLNEGFREHKSGKVKATRSRLPLKLVYYEACISNISKEKAVARSRFRRLGDRPSEGVPL